MDSQIKGKSFLITGGAGFIGSNLVEHLLSSGAKKVRILDNFFAKTKKNIQEFKHHPAFELVEKDIRDLTACQKACQDIDYIYHLAAVNSVPRSIKNPRECLETNVNGFLNLLLAAKNSGVKRIVYASSSSVYGDNPKLSKREEDLGKPLSPYAVSKRSSELLAQNFSDLYGMEIVGLRFFNVFGPRQDPGGDYAAVIPKFIQMTLSGKDKPSVFGDGEQLRDFSYVENVIQGSIKAMFSKKLKSKHEIFNIAVSEKTSSNQLIQNLSRLSGQKIQVNYLPKRKGDILNSHADISKAKEQLDYQPSVKFEEGLKKTFNCFKRKLESNS